MKITEIRIKGFMGHTDSVVPLGPGLNVITGPTDEGKTTILRVIRWVAFGEPLGDAFRYKVIDPVTKAIIEEADVVAVEIDTSDGVTVSKSRTKAGKTTYRLSTVPEPWEKAEVPPEVMAALGLTKQTFGDFKTSLNFAWQLEAPFILSEPPSVGAKIAGTLAGTEVIDLAIKAVAKDTYAARQERLESEKEIERKEKDLIQYKDLEALAEKMTACEYLVAGIDQALADGDRLAILARKFTAAVDMIVAYSVELDKLANLPILTEDLAAIEVAQARYDRLLTLYGRYDEIGKTLTLLATRLTDYENLELAATLLDLATTGAGRLDKLRNLDAVYGMAQAAAEQADETLAHSKDLDLAAAALTAVQEAVPRLTILTAQAARHDAAAATVARLDAALAYTATTAEAAEKLPIIETAYERLVRLADLQRRYAVKEKTAGTADLHYKAAAKEETTLRDYLGELWASVTACPLCERPM